MEVFLIKALQLIASLSLLVILHEGGHFFFAKLFHTRVEKFSLFFGYKFDIFSTYSKWFRKLIGKQPAKVKYIKDRDGNDVPDGYEYEGTEYAIGWIPLGGYVKISGMIDESMDTEQMKQPAKPWEFRSKPAYQRLLIMVGGVLVNFLLALFIYSMILFAWGESYVSPKDMTLGMTFNEQAKNLGFKDGDKVIGADDEVFEKFNGSMLRSVSNAKTVKILRQDKEMKINMPEEGVSLLDMLKSTRPFMMVSIPTVVREVINDTPASEAGINVGDTLLAINGTSLKTWTDYNVYIAELGESLKDAPTYDSIQARHVSIVLKRAKTNVVDTINVFLNSELKMGIMQDSANSFYTPTEVNYSFFESIPAGIEYGCQTLAGYVSDLKYLFTSDGVKSVGSFGAMGDMFAPEWDWHRFWEITALFSIILAFMNILPIPALDGGHVLFLLVEVVTRRKPSDKFLERAQIVGMILLFALMALALGNDIIRFIF